MHGNCPTENMILKWRFCPYLCGSVWGSEVHVWCLYPSLSLPTLIYETVSLIESGAHRLTWLANFSASLLRPLVSVPSGHTQL